MLEGYMVIMLITLKITNGAQVLDPLLGYCGKHLVNQTNNIPNMILWHWLWLYP
jgi:hypothetical protein